MKYKYVKKDYQKAKVYGRCAFIMNLANVSFTLIFGMVLIFSVLGVFVHCSAINIIVFHKIYYQGKLPWLYTWLIVL